MSTFRFRLQKVLELREWRERERGAELAHAQSTANKARDIRDAITAAHAAGIAQINAAHGAGGSAGELQRLHAVISQLEQHVVQAAAASNEAEQKASAALADFTAAAQARHALEDLRERKQLLWRAAQADLELKRMDEIALTRHTNIVEDDG